MPATRDEMATRRLLTRLLAPHGLAPDDLAPGARGRFRRSVHSGVERIGPGPRCLASSPATTNPDGDVRLHWSTEVAGLLRKKLLGDTPPAPHMILVPTAAYAVARAAGWSDAKIASLYPDLETDRTPPNNTKMYHRPPRLPGTARDSIDRHRRFEVPNWFLHFSLDLVQDVRFAIRRIDHNSLLLRQPLPDSIVAALPGRRLDEVLDLPGAIEGADGRVPTIIAATNINMQFSQSWRPIGDAPADADMRWVQIALQGATAQDDGN